MGSLVLVAEDDPKQAELIRVYLAREGHTVTVVGDGRSAINRARPQSRSGRARRDDARARRTRRLRTAAGRVRRRPAAAGDRQPGRQRHPSHADRGTVSVRTWSAGDRAMVEVSDTGTGISPQHLPHVFDRFWRADPARGRDTGGSGLGLATARQIVLDHDGDINVASTVDWGTTFTITLPLPSPDRRRCQVWAVA